MPGVGRGDCQYLRFFTMANEKPTAPTPVAASERPITSAFNDAYIADRYDEYRRDPESGDGSCRQFFDVALEIVGGSGGATAPIAAGREESVADAALLKKAAGAAALMQAT